jgi:hypothetical protein
VQYGRYPYAISWGSVATDSDSVLGDLEALGRMRVRDYDMFNITNMYIGRRAINRGEDFSAFLNCSDDQMAPGQSVTLVAAGTSFQDAYISPTTRCVQWAPGGIVAPTNIFYITIDAAHANQYVGMYRVFMRFYQSNLPAAEHEFMMLAMAFGNLSNEVWYSDKKDTRYEAATQTSTMGLCDLGVITIPPRGLSMNSLDMGALYFKIYANEYVVAGFTHKYYDLILLPYDEMYLQPIFNLEYQYNVNPGYIGDIDSMGVLALKERNILSTYPITDQVSSVTVLGKMNAGNPLQLRQNTASKYWMMNTHARGAIYLNTRIATHRVKLNHATRYLGMRGNR